MGWAIWPGNGQVMYMWPGNGQVMYMWPGNGQVMYMWPGNGAGDVHVAWEWGG